MRSSKAIPGPLDEPDFERTLEEAIVEDSQTILPFENVTRIVSKRRPIASTSISGKAQTPQTTITKDIPCTIWVLSFGYAMMLLVVALAMKQLDSHSVWSITPLLCGCMMLVSHGILAQAFYAIPRLALVHGLALTVVDYHLAGHFTFGSIPFAFPWMFLASHLFVMGILPDGVLRAGHPFLKSYQIGQWIVLCFFASIIAMGCVRIPNDATSLLAMLPMLHRLLCVTFLLMACANKALLVPCGIVCTTATLAVGFLPWPFASVSPFSDSSTLESWGSPIISLLLLATLLHGRSILHTTQLIPTDLRSSESLATGESMAI